MSQSFSFKDEFLTRKVTSQRIFMLHGCVVQYELQTFYDIKTDTCLMLEGKYFMYNANNI